MLQEMQMLTGVVTNDYDYLVYLLLKGNDALFNEKIEESKYEDVAPVSVTAIDMLDDWFKELEEAN